MKNPALSDEEAGVIRESCDRWAEFALEAYLNTQDEPRRLDRLIVLAIRVLPRERAPRRPRRLGGN